MSHCSYDPDCGPKCPDKVEVQKIDAPEVKYIYAVIRMASKPGHMPDSVSVVDGIIEGLPDAWFESTEGDEYWIDDMYAQEKPFKADPRDIATVIEMREMLE